MDTQISDHTSCIDRYHLCTLTWNSAISLVAAADTSNLTNSRHLIFFLMTALHNSCFFLCTSTLHFQKVDQQKYPLWNQGDFILCMVYTNKHDYVQLIVLPWKRVAQRAKLLPEEVLLQNAQDFRHMGNICSFLNLKLNPVARDCLLSKLQTYLLQNASRFATNSTHLTLHFVC